MKGGLEGELKEKVKDEKVKDKGGEFGICSLCRGRGRLKKMKGNERRAGRWAEGKGSMWREEDEREER